jgi:surface protein
MGSKFNMDISNWDVSNVINMDSMFYNTNLYNITFALKWNFTKVSSMINFISSRYVGYLTSSSNYSKTAAIFVNLNKNKTFIKKTITNNSGSSYILYLSTPTSTAALNSLTTTKQNIIFTNQFIPVMSDFKQLNYSTADLITIGYSLKDILTL